ncbi:TetR family transcriptional regulator [Streptomyces blattellae]|uniref:TetR family transcriptional regulator n=1 Tax=Streptomyces blattellae TaxID=2569855 RepID=UPI0012B8343D|nr:TetR family transcriptional regulator [Streptomyces blattellae]
MSEFQRARRPEHKEQRRQAILSAARRLATVSGVHNVTLSGVAAAVGLAKSNMSRYFGTREEMYLELASECWREWRQAVVERLSTGDDVVTTLTETLQARPLFCDLLGHTGTTLEHNVSVPAARDSKHTMIVVIEEIGAAIAAADQRLTASEGRELVTAAAGLAGAVYSAANPPPTLAEAYGQNPELAAARLLFLPTMQRLVGALSAGLPALRPHIAYSATS